MGEESIRREEGKKCIDSRGEEVSESSERYIERSRGKGKKGNGRERERGRVEGGGERSV